MSSFEERRITNFADPEIVETQLAVAGCTGFVEMGHIEPSIFSSPYPTEAQRAKLTWLHNLLEDDSHL